MRAHRLLELLPPSFPEVALLLEPPLAYGLRVSRGGPGPSLLARTEQELVWPEEGEPSAAAFGSLAERALTALGQPPRLSLLLGDALMKMQVLTLTDFPAAEEEREQVLRWHVRKVLNFTLDGLRLRYQLLGRTEGAVTLWLTLVPESLVASLESAFGQRGCHVGYIGAVTPELFNLALRGGALPAEGASLLVNRSPRSVSFLFAERGQPQFFRCKELRGVEGDEDPERLGQEVRLTLAYHRERLGGAPLRAVFVRRHPAWLALPVEDEAGADVVVAPLRERLPALAGGGERPEAGLPLFSVLEA